MNTERLAAMLKRAVVCCTFAVFGTCVCALLSAVSVKGCGVSRGMMMNGSVVTSQVQLPLCHLHAACSPIIPQPLHFFGASAQ